MTDLRVGDAAPEFTLFDSRHRAVSLKDFRGKHVILYFYPKDDTPGCTREACEFRDDAKEFGGLNAVVVGISKDNESSHAAFINKYSLPFALLADPEAEVLRQYGVWREKSFMGRIGLGTVRTTFWIDPAGIIRKIYPKVKVAGHVAAVLAELKAGGKA